MLQSFFAFIICLPRRYGLLLKIQACERCETLFLLSRFPSVFILQKCCLTGSLALLFCFVYVAEHSQKRIALYSVFRIALFPTI
jgi:hypothetical protein